MSRRFAFVAALLTLSACGHSEAEREEQEMRAATPQRLQPDGTIRLSDADQRAVGLEVTAATDGELPDVTLRLGRAHAPLREQALVVSPVAGRIPNAPKVALGAAVREGDVLVEVVPVLSGAERASLQIQGADVEGQIQATTHELALREAEAARARELAPSNIISQAKLQEAETAVQTTRARLDALRRSKSMRVAGEWGSIPLRAPVAGTVVSLDARVGDVVKAGDLLAQVLRTGPRWVDVLAAPDDPIGTSYEVGAGGAWVRARLLTRGAVVEDDGARHDRLEVSADQAAAILPGATVSVRVALGSGKGIVLPETAVAAGARADTVFVRVAPGVFSPRSVHVAARFDGRVRLAPGPVRAGDMVLTRGAMSLRGESVRSELRHVE